MGTDTATANTPAPRGWPLFLGGVLLFFLGPILYVIMFAGMHQTTMPWYMLILTTLGVLLMAASVVRRFGVLRTIGVVVFGAITALQWTFFLAIARTPEYTGPAQPGMKAPEFTTSLADGRSFGNRDFESGDGTVILFYRGHW